MWTKFKKKIGDFITILLVIVGIALLFIAVEMPFKVYEYFVPKSAVLKIVNYTDVRDLGPIGDFIGGTTVAFLTAASTVFLLATIIMQRKEIKISQRNIEELVKQTEASVAQAEEARKETRITNETMKQQQFETTFFNMINLQHNILKEIQYGDYAGREAILKLYRELKNTYDNQIYKQYRTKFINNIVTSGNINKLNDLVKKSLIGWELWHYKHDFDSYFVPTINGNGEEDFSELEAFYKSLSNGTNKGWNKIEADVIQDFEKNIKNKREKCGEVLEDFDFKSYLKNENENKIKDEYITEFKINYYDDPLIELKHQAYENLYKKHENLIGHYYRNLYRIVKLIQSHTFNSESQERDNEEKRKYRGILRAQLSSFELLMLFYNISYSEKGKKFKELIEGINFFDDHLIEKDFIWKNDVKELASLNASKVATETNSI
ncbi:putative phage abortive infection protein [Bacillus cereus]|uniref:putative phage abortive infection protein n=1 Tax=Bacillus cereus TaxID=1396 RepID=UPI001EF7A016|nr:putative phage abortive infection protein [Bacillus cereus]